MPKTRESTRSTLLAVIVIFITGFVLYVAQAVVVPVLFAVFLAILIQPLVARLSRKLPYWLSLVIVLLCFTLAFVVTGLLLVNTVASMIQEAPRYSARFEKIFTRAVEYARTRGLEPSWKGLGVQENISKALGFVGSGLTSVATVIGKFSVVAVLTVFALIEARGFGGKIVKAFGPDRSRDILKVLEPMAESVQRYLRTKTLVSLVTGAVAYVACLAIGIDFAFMWGVLVFLLNYLPYFGPTVAVVPAIVVAFVQYDSPTRGIIAVCTLGLAQWLSGSVIEPQIMGRSLKLSVLFLIISMLFWGWFWGLAGVVLSIPLASAFVIGCAHVEKLKPIASLLGAIPSEENGEGEAGGEGEPARAEG